MKSTYSMVRSTIAAAAIAGAAAGSLALVAPAFAADTMVTGYQTGYTYHEGLANGSGAALMAQQDQATQSSGITTTDTTAAPADVSVAPVNSQTTELPATPQVAIVPAAQTQTTVAPAASPSLAAQLAAVPVTTWAAIALILLALILAILMLATPSETVTRTRTTRSYQYH